MFFYLYFCLCFPLYLNGLKILLYLNIVNILLFKGVSLLDFIRFLLALRQIVVINKSKLF
jgi:hypothetical protein